MSELAVGVYLDAVDWLIDLVAREEIAESWEAPSALARYSVGGVAVHAVLGGVVRLCEALVGPEPSEGRRVKLTEYFALNRIDDPKGDDPLFVAACGLGPRRSPTRGTCHCARWPEVPGWRWRTYSLARPPTVPLAL